MRRFILWTVFILIVSCHKNSDSIDGDDESPGVSKASGDSVQVSGKIQIDNFPKGKVPNKVLILGGAQSSRAQSQGYTSALEISDSGTFSAELESGSSNSLNLDNEDEDSAATVYLIVASAGKSVGLLLEDDLDLEDRMKIADSFYYIALPSAQGTLSGWPVDSMKGNLSLGDISYKKGTEDIKSELKASTKVYDLSKETINQFSSTDDTLKTLKNNFINPDYSMSPFYAFNIAEKATVEDKFNTPDQSEYNGYGFYVSVSNPVFTYEDICTATTANRKLLELVPPSTVYAGATYGNITPSSPFNNNSTSESTQNGRRMCSGSATGYYAREDVYDDETSFMLNWGTGGSIEGEIPSGYWYLKYQGEELGAFELASSNPINKDGKPIVFVPSYKVVTSGSNISSVEVKFYFWDTKSESYELITDTTILDQLASQLTFSVDTNSAEYRFFLSDPEDGVYTVSGNSLDADGTTRLNTITRSNDIRSYSMSYMIESTTFRWEARNTSN